MKYLALIYIDADKLAETPASDCMAYADHLRASGRLHAAEALWASRPATTVRLRKGRVAVTDGPFPETRELLAGFYVIEASDLTEAIEIIAKTPPLPNGRAELRPVYTLEP